MLMNVAWIVHDVLPTSPEFWLSVIDALAYFAAACAAIRGHRPWLAFLIYLLLFTTHGAGAAAHAAHSQHATQPSHAAPSLDIRQSGPPRPRLILPFPHR